ncbi:zinc ion-binding protein [Prunus dulcis]|uniref:Zinc ion-binding protein n=1 Tax=Prunus dulcis TaxID=3755 RepID=A0A4Y1QQL2_PRUDU|nr:zinc ion-binding protein [Prunus dulcis]
MAFTTSRHVPIVHWPAHKEECGRLEQHMKHMDILNEFPFTFTQEATVQGTLSSAFLFCHLSVITDVSSGLNNSWDLSNTFCPCTEPLSMISKHLTSWKEYYEWRSIPLHSPVSLLLHRPLTIYYATQVAGLGRWTSGISHKLHIHYLGPEKELLQLSVFSELHALFPNVHVHIELIGPAIPQHRDGEMIELCNYAHCLDRDCVCKSSSETVSWDAHTSKPSTVTLQLRSGFYHDRYKDIAQVVYFLSLSMDINILAKDHSIKSIQATNGGGRQRSLASLLLELLPLRDVKVVCLKLYLVSKTLLASSNKSLRLSDRKDKLSRRIVSM